MEWYIWKEQFNKVAYLYFVMGTIKAGIFKYILTNHMRDIPGLLLTL